MVKVTAVVVCTLLYAGGWGSFEVFIGVGIVLLVALAIIRDLREVPTSDDLAKSRC